MSQLPSLVRPAVLRTSARISSIAAAVPVLELALRIIEVVSDSCLCAGGSAVCRLLLDRSALPEERRHGAAHPRALPFIRLSARPSRTDALAGTSLRVGEKSVLSISRDSHETDLSIARMSQSRAQG